MIRLRLLQAAALLLLLLLQIASVEGLMNKTGCETTKACWLSLECVHTEHNDKNKKSFYLIETKADGPGIPAIDTRDDCTKYFIIEPGENEFVFELMISGIDKEKKVRIVYTSKNGVFTCQNQKVTSSDEITFLIETMPSPEQQNFFCRFKVSMKGILDKNKSFWERFADTFSPINVKIQSDGEPDIQVDNYNEEVFLGRVPCNNVFLEGIHDKEHLTKPQRDVSSRYYMCPPNYTMSHKLFTDSSQTQPEKDFQKTTKNIQCRLGKTLYDGIQLKVSSAKCARPTNSLCSDLTCSNCEGQLHNKIDGGKRTIECTTRFMIINHNIISRPIASCDDNSTPENHLWSGDFKARPITDVKCVNHLDCNDITPFEDADCQYCSNITHSKDGLKCENGDRMIMIDKSSNARYNVTITCNNRTGDWQLQYDGKSLKGNQKEMKKWKFGCAGTREKEKEQPKPAAASSGMMLYVGIGLGMLLFILLIVLLLYYICCRKGRKEKPKEESSKQPTPPATQPKTAESSNVEVPVSPPHVAPASTESSEPQRYSGQRVQMINMSKEHLREIEPDDPFKEFSARDKTDSDRSKASQMSQVGGTTDAGQTFTGRQTEKTNEMSRTVANGDDTRSEVSRGNSLMGDNSQTGAGGSTPTIGDAAKKKERKGPRVAFRERVSYETDPTKTRDKSSVASMHTAPEQPAPLVDSTQAEGSTQEGKKKDEPSRLDAEAARNAFGKERTRTTQNTKDQDSIAGNRSTSRVTDMSKTG